MELTVRLSAEDLEAIAQRVAALVAVAPAATVDQLLLGDMPIKAAYNIAEIANAFGLDRATVEAAIRRNVDPLPHKRFGRRTLIPRVALLEWLRRGEQWRSADEVPV